MKQEHTIQAHVCNFLRLKGCMVIDADVMAGLVYLPVNHPSRFAFVNAHKQMGYTKGQPDLIVLKPDGRTLLVEMKAGKQGKQSKEQKYFEEWALRHGFKYCVWRSLEDCFYDFNNNNTMEGKGHD